MIAETSARGQRLGWEAMTLMLRYGFEILHIDQFEAKIKISNGSSIAMFQKLQFVESGKSFIVDCVIWSSTLYLPFK